MHKTAITVFTIICLAPLLAPAVANPLTHTREALWQSADTGNGSAGVQFTTGRRKLESDRGNITVDIDRIAVSAGYDVLPFAHLALAVGTARLEQPADQGDFGIFAGLALDLNLFEHQLPTKVECDTRAFLNAGARASLTYSESDTDTSDFELLEYGIGPSVTYSVIWKESAIRMAADPRAIALRTSVLFSGVEGDYGVTNLNEDRTVGIGLDVSVLLASRWVAEAGVVLYGSSDTLYTLGARYRF